MVKSKGTNDWPSNLFVGNLFRRKEAAILCDLAIAFQKGANLLNHGLLFWGFAGHVAHAQEITRHAEFSNNFLQLQFCHVPAGVVKTWGRPWGFPL